MSVRADLLPPLDFPSVLTVQEPAVQRAPIVLSSPHSGDEYPADFVAQSALDPISLRRSEDSFVDRLYADGPLLGLPLLAARFPRAYIDPNRDAWELDPGMFADTLPDYVKTGGPRVAAGFGTIARVVANGAPIYRALLRFSEAVERVERYYRPYHSALTGLLDRTAQRFGAVILIDCHSMPSIGGPTEADAGRKRIDFILGDCHGTSCDPRLIDRVEACLTDLGYRVGRNDPYAGGYITRTYGQPRHGRHALQIEINRALYMDEALIAPRGDFARIQGHIRQMLSDLIPLAHDLANDLTNRP